jgi:IS30 family transposase
VQHPADLISAGYIDQVSDEEIQDIVITANLTPRKCLGFKTPFQAILKELGKDVQIRFA